LVRLIQDKQPVVLHLPQKEIGASTILFYDNKAWCPKSDFDFLKMPSGEAVGPKCGKPIFVLVDSSEGEPRGMAETTGWPIYSVSPKPALFREFRKHRDPVLWGVYLWTVELLRKG
jgi:hypothetical protein